MNSAKLRPKETPYDILHGGNKRPGKEGMMPSSDQAPALTARQVSERENSKHLKSILGHDHSLDPKVNGFHTTHRQSFESPRKCRARFGVRSGTRNELHAIPSEAESRPHAISCK